MTEDERFSESAPEDVEVHRDTWVDPQAGEDDVEGHRPPGDLDPRANEDDVSGHGYRWDADTWAGEDDVEGHLHSGAIRPDVYGDAGRTP